MTLSGWWKFHRAMMNHAVWNLTEGQFKVWITILVLANHRDRDWWDGGERLTISAGSLVRTQRGLAEDARVSRIVVRHALSNLVSMGSIRAHKRAQNKVLIEVVNWPLYQGDDTEVSPQTSPERAQGEPSGSPTGRMKEGKNEKKDPSPAAGLTLDDYLQQRTPEGQAILRQTVQAIASTRKSGKVASSVLDAQARKWSQYPAVVVLHACRTYLDKRCAEDKKGEAYLFGIIKGESKKQNGNSREPSSPVVGQKEECPSPRPAPKTPGRIAIDRALAAMQAEQEQAR